MIDRFLKQIAKLGGVREDLRGNLRLTWFGDALLWEVERFLNDFSRQDVVL